MGKAALDLPDPLQSPPEGVKTSTDDLLAQLAGDEIDRLLAEADGAQPHPVSRAPFHVAPPTGSGKETGSAVATPATVPAEPPAPSSTELDVAAEMDALFSAATAKDEAAAAAIAGAAAAAEAETSAAERDGLQVPAGVASAGRPDGQPLMVEADDAPLPLYLRPLEWLNAPLAILPESVRDVIGKVAIITLINAAVILAYVLVVRRG